MGTESSRAQISAERNRDRTEEGEPRPDNKDLRPRRPYRRSVLLFRNPPTKAEPQQRPRPTVPPLFPSLPPPYLEIFQFGSLE